MTDDQRGKPQVPDGEPHISLSLMGATINSPIHPRAVEDPQTWAEVRKRASQSLKVILAGVGTVTAEAFKAVERMLTGAFQPSQPPPSSMARIEEAHRLADRGESRLEEKPLPTNPVADLGKLLAHLRKEVQSRGGEMAMRIDPETGNAAVAITGVDWLAESIVLVEQSLRALPEPRPYTVHSVSAVGSVGVSATAGGSVPQEGSVDEMEAPPSSQ